MLQRSSLCKHLWNPQNPRRYAEFAAAIVGINETFPHEQMNRLLAVLQEEVTQISNLADTTVKSQAGFHSMESKKGIVI